MSAYPIVEVLYSYESTNDRGHSVIVQPGERYALLCDQDDEWWYVSKDVESDDGFYIPRTYVKPANVRFSSYDSNLLETFRRPVANRQSAIITTNLYSLATATNGGDGTSTANGGSSLRRQNYNPGFKLADPKRISRSIPVDLNFVHHIPHFNNGFNNISPTNENDENDIDEKTSIVTAVRKQPNEISNGSSSNVKVNDGPIYANLPPLNSESPPVPSDFGSYIRSLHDGWKTYEDEFGRPFFYNTRTGVSTWKPPRVVSTMGLKFDPGMISSSGEELDSSFSTDDQAEINKTKEKYNLHCEEQFEHSAAEEPFDSGANVNQRSEVVDSFCEPPSLPSSFESSKTDNDGETSKPKEKVLTFVNRSFGVPPRLPVKDTAKDTTRYSEDLASIAGSQSPEANSNDPPAFYFLQKDNSFRRNSQTVIKSGELSKCKFMEAGKRIKKQQWICCYVYLTSAHMIFYKDEKSAEKFQKKGNQYEAPLGVCDLRGAKLKWLEGDKTRKRRVFQLDLADGATYLFHSEDNQEIIGWFHAVQQVVARLPLPDFYPAPHVESSPNRSHSRKFSGSSYSFMQKGAHELERKPTVTVQTKEKSSDHKKNCGTSMTSSLIDSYDHSLQITRESILDKLRRFFSLRPSIESLKERGIYKPEPVFGSDLIDICNRERSNVPKFIKICTALIEEKGLENDGLYRMSGNLSQVQKIRCQVDQDKYTLLQNETDIHVLTGALKLFFRELPNPLFPFDMTKDFLSAIRIQDHKARLKKFRELIARMPIQHRDCLDLLLKHLLRVAEHASKNRMQIHNLAIVFGPTLFSTDSNRTAASGDRSKKKANAKTSNATNSNGANRKTSVEAIQSNSHLAFTMIMQGQIVEYMLKDHDRLFKVDKVTTGGISY